MTARDKYINTKQVQLDKWNYDIDTMTAKADKVSSHSMLDYHTQIGLLLAMQATVREKIKKLQEADENCWEEMKADMELTWGDMAKLMDSAGHHFR